MNALATVAGRVCRTLLWPLRTLWRIVILGWLVGLAVVGGAALAFADDGPIVGPDLAQGAAQTVFEQAPWYGYGLPTYVSPDQGWPEQMMWGALNLISLVLNLISAVLVRGALVAMQWMLNLTLYRDNAAEIDAATQSVAASVFWPLIACTMAAAGFTMYARAKRDGSGAILGEAFKVAILGVLAIAFVTAPSNIVGPLDDARTAASSAIMTGYSGSRIAAGGSVAGFEPVEVPDTPAGANRALADGMWNTFVLAPWCYTAFGGEQTCREWGQDYITDSPRWQTVDVGIVVGDLANGLSAGSAPDACVASFGPACDSVRGNTISRVAAAAVGALVAIPAALLLIVLAVFGLLAVIGVLFLAMMAPLFVLSWMIPGVPRSIGLRWFQALLGCMLQSALIAGLLGVVMVLGAILWAMVPTYGFWMVGLLNLAVLVMAIRVRAMFETVLGMASPAGASLASSYVVMRTLGVLGRAGRNARQRAGQAAGVGAAAGVSAARHAGAGAAGAGMAAATGARRVGRAVVPFFATKTASPSRGGSSGIATPFRDGSHGAGQGPRTITAASSSSPQVVDALPSAPSRRAITAASSSTASQVSGPAFRGAPPAPKRRRGSQAPARTFSSGTSQPGVVHSARRKIVQPSRRDILTDPPAVTRRARPVTSRAELLGRRT
jgi:hypothetical protein